MFQRHIAVVVCLALAGSACHRAKKVQKPLVTSITVGEAAAKEHLLRGFYEGQGPWRWTDRVFAVSLDSPSPTAAIYLELEFAYPQELAGPHPEATILARANGVEVCRKNFERTGLNLISCFVPSPALKKTPVELEFELNRSFRDVDSGRQQAVIVTTVSLKEWEQTVEYHDRQMNMAREASDKVLAAHRAYATPQQAREMIALFHKLPVWDSLWFQSVRVIKNPLDLWVMQQIIGEIRPDFIIETGTWQGGSALYLAQVLHGLGLEHSKILTIDIGFHNQPASGHFLWKKYVEFIHGSSTDPVIVGQIAERVKGKKVLVDLDSDHTMKHVFGEITAFAPMVSKGSYLIVEDMHLDGIPTHPEQGPGPTAAVKKFLEEGGNKEFEQDLSREALVMTWNAGGWLRRK